MIRGARWGSGKGGFARRCRALNASASQRMEPFRRAKRAGYSSRVQRSGLSRRALQMIRAGRRPALRNRLRLQPFLESRNSTA